MFSPGRRVTEAAPSVCQPFLSERTVAVVRLSAAGAAACRAGAARDGAALGWADGKGWAMASLRVEGSRLATAVGAANSDRCTGEAEAERAMEG